jgi:hypothetical protein
MGFQKSGKVSDAQIVGQIGQLALAQKGWGNQ